MLILILISFLSVFTFSQDFNSDVNNYLNQKFTGYDKVEFSVQSKINSTEVVEIDNTREFKYQKGYGYLPVVIKRNNRTSLSIITLNISLYKNVLVAKTDILKKSEINNDAIEFQLRNVTNVYGHPVTDINMLKNYCSKITIKNDEILLTEMLEKIPVIKSGDKIIAELNTGSITISTDAIARQDGSSGDIIQVVSKENKLFKARVVDSNKVIIE